MICSINKQTIKNGIKNDVVSTLLATGRFSKQGDTLIKTTDPFSNLEKSINGLDDNTKKLLITSIKPEDWKVNNGLPTEQYNRVLKYLENNYSKSNTLKNLKDTNQVNPTGEIFLSQNPSLSDIVDSLNKEGIEETTSRVATESLYDYIYGQYTTKDIIENRNEEIDSILDRVFSDSAIIDEINSEYGEQVVSIENDQVKINPSEELLQEYVDVYRADREADKIVSETMTLSVPQVSPTQSNKVQHLLNKLGISTQKVNNIPVKGQTIGANAVALPMQALINYTENQEHKLPEEAFHIALEILEEKHPGLLNQMLGAITNFPIYKEVYDQYSSLPEYQKDGKPDVRKIKKEAIAQQLAKQIDQDAKIKTWWEKVVSFLRSLFSTSDVDIRPFKEALDSLLNDSDIGTVRSTILQSPRYLRSKGISEDNINQIAILAKSPISDEELRLHIEQITPTEAFYSISSETQNSYTKIKNSIYEAGEYKDILTKVRESLQNLFGSDREDITESILNDFRNKETTKVNSAIQDILNRYITENGTLRTAPLPFTGTDIDANLYEAIEDRISSKLNQYKDGKFIINKEIATPKTGTKAKIDIIAIDSKGNASILQFLPTTLDRIDANYTKVVEDYLRELQSTLSKQYNIRTAQVRAISLPSESYNLKDESIDKDIFPEMVSILDRTGSARVDALIGRLNSIMRNPSLTAGDDQIIYRLTKAIRSIQVDGSPEKIAQVINAINNRIEVIIHEYEESYPEGMTFSDIDQEKMTDTANELYHLISLGSGFANIYTALTTAHKENPEVYKDPPTILKRLEGQLNTNLSRLHQINSDFQDRFVSKSANVENILVPERPISFYNKTFKTIYEAKTRAVEVLARTWNRINRYTSDKTQQEVRNKISKIKESYDAMFKASGKSKEEYLSFIAKKDKNGEYVHELIEKYDKDAFEKGLKTALKDKDYTWIKNNVDLKAYQEWYNQAHKNIVQDYNNIEYHSDKETNEEIIQKKISSWENTFKVDADNLSENNNKLKDFITDKHLSKEYVELQKNPAALALHSYILDINNRAYQARVITKEQSERLIPFVEKGILDRLVQGGGLAINPNILKGLTSPEEYAEITKRDPNTGRREERVPFYFTKDISKQRKDGTRDYSNVSQDIFQIMTIYYAQTVTAEEIRKKEAQLKLLGLLEQNKEVLNTNKFNEADISGGDVKNTVNAEYYENFLSGSIYGNKLIDDNDTQLGKLSGKGAEWMNKTFGTNFDTAKTTVTLNNFVHTMNRLFMAKVLSGNIMIPLANFVGANAQTLINTNKREFSQREYIKNMTLAMSEKFTSKEERERFHGLAEYFQLFYNKEDIQRSARKMSISKLTTRTIPEWLMGLQEISEIPIQLGIGMSMLENYMVDDGKIVKIYDKVSNKYPNYLDVSEAERKVIDKKIEDEINQIKKKSSLKAIAKIENDELVIPGLERGSESVYDFIGKIHGTVRRATGGGTRESFRQANQNIWLGSMMMFKSWLPRLMENRFGKLQKASDLQGYEMGRYNAVLLQMANKKFVDKIRSLYDVATMNDRGVALLKEQYEEQRNKYKERTGEELEMTAKDYVLMQRDLIHSSVRDAMFMSVFLSLVAGIGALGGDDDEDRSGSYKFIMNMANRFYKEMSLFYNPMEMYKIQDGGIFPAAGVVRDFLTLGKETTKTVTHLITQDEELEKNTKFLKSLTAPFPGSNMINMYFPLIAEEYAKELGYKPPRMN